MSKPSTQALEHPRTRVKTTQDKNRVSVHLVFFNAHKTLKNGRMSSY